MAENGLHLEAIFFAARQKPPKERAAYLDQVCGDDPVLRERAEQFLSAQAHIGSFLEPGALPPVATVDDPITERPGTVIDSYKLIEQIGEGGMGLVFVAERSSRATALCRDVVAIHDDRFTFYPLSWKEASKAGRCHPGSPMPGACRQG
jgi:hypothetical protein